MEFGIIADDFTGATDAAGFLVANGVTTSLWVGPPPEDAALSAQAAVVSLKSRTCPPRQAVDDSLDALGCLRRAGVRRIYQKYCSTFDSTSRGNIGPVADALMDALEVAQTVVCPALPINGRTIYNGYLFVDGVLLEETGMRHHPVNPMTDSHLGRLMEAQSRGRAGVLAWDVVEAGSKQVESRLREMADEGIRYVVLDVLRQQHLDTLAAALADMPLATGGSGLASSIARHGIDDRISPDEAAALGRPQPGPAVVLSGSCSEMTRAQVAVYAAEAPSRAIDVDRCMTDSEKYAEELAAWVDRNRSSRWAPLVYATTDPESLRDIRQRHGGRAAEAVEDIFAALAVLLETAGTTRFVVAGGETSGAVVQSLGIRGFHVGPQIAPGVPWVRSVDSRLSMALKSGNFGPERFFFICQEDAS